MTELHRWLGPWLASLALVGCSEASPAGKSDNTAGTDGGTPTTASGEESTASTGSGGSATTAAGANGTNASSTGGATGSSNGASTGATGQAASTAGMATTSGDSTSGDSTSGDSTSGDSTSGDTTTGGGGRPSYATLREAAAAANRLIGAAVDAAALAGAGTQYSETLAREFDYVTPENATKWGPLAPTSSSYDWQGADAIVDFAEGHQEVVKGHTFVWHEQTPSWVSTSMSASELNAALKSHIETTLARYRGRMRAWDVVNEAVDVNTASGYRESVFYQVLGPGYIADAFRWARAADPDVLLFYNEIGAERLGAKSDFMYTMIQELLDAGVPIDGVGLQSHVSTHRYPSESDLRANIRRFADLGLRVNISEVDARTKNVPGTQEARWLMERIAFQQVVGSCVVEPGCEAITFWGVTDSYSWLNEESEEDPLLFDRSYMRKPAYAGALDGFLGLLPVRGANLVANSDFAGGATGWEATTGELTVAAAEGESGNAACVNGRTDVGDGLLQSGLLEALQAGGPLAFSAMLRVDAPSSVEAALLIVEGGEESEFNIASRAIAQDQWLELSGYLGLGFEQAPSAIALKLYGPASGVELCATRVQLQPLTVD